MQLTHLDSTVQPSTPPDRPEAPLAQDLSAIPSPLPPPQRPHRAAAVIEPRRWRICRLEFARVRLGGDGDTARICSPSEVGR